MAENLRPEEEPTETPRTEAGAVRNAVGRNVSRTKPYRVCQDGNQVRVTFHPEEPIQGRTMEATIDTMLTELAYALSARGNRRYLCTPVRDADDQCTALIVTNADQEPVIPGTTPQERQAQDREDDAAVASVTLEEWGELHAALNSLSCPELPDVPFEPGNSRTTAQLKLVAEAAIDLARISGFHHPAQLRLDAAYLRKIGSRLSDQAHIDFHEGRGRRGQQFAVTSLLLHLLEGSLPDYAPVPISAAVRRRLLDEVTWDGLRQHLDSMEADGKYCNEVFPRLRGDLKALDAAPAPQGEDR